MLKENDLLKNMTYKFEEPFGDERLKELILYIASKCQDDQAFGATKLDKILYFADTISFSKFGEPITGVEYMRLGQGPAPKHLVPVSKQMQANHEIFMENRNYFGFSQQRVVPMREPDLNIFKPRDIAIVDEVIKIFWEESASDVSRLSHGIAWKMFEDKQSIPYEAAYLSDRLPTDEDVDWAEELIAKHGW